MKKLILAVIMTILAQMCTSSVFAVSPYTDAINKIADTHGTYKVTDSGVINGLMYGEFVDFDRDGTDEMLLVYRAKDQKKGTHAYVEVYANVNGALEKVFSELLAKRTGQSDTEGALVLRSAKENVYLFFDAEKDSVSYGDNQKLKVFTMTGNKAETHELYAEVKPISDTYEVEYTKCTVDGEKVEPIEYTTALNLLYNGMRRVVLSDGVFNCTYDNLMKFINEAKTKTLDKITVTLNGDEIAFDQPPVIVNDRTLVPLRAIFEALGAEVDWDGDTRTVTATKADTQIKMTISKSEMLKNSESITLDVPPQIVNDRTLVPVRAIAESFDCDVDWNGDTRTVIIKTE